MQAHLTFHITPTSSWSLERSREARTSSAFCRSALAAASLCSSDDASLSRVYASMQVQPNDGGGEGLRGKPIRSEEHAVQVSF